MIKPMAFPAKIFVRIPLLLALLSIPCCLWSSTLLGQTSNPQVLYLDDELTKLLNRKELDAARTLVNRFIASFEQSNRPNDPNLASIQNRIANIYFKSGYYTHADPLYKRALEIREKAFGPEHLDVATSLLNLAGNHAKLRRHELSLPLNIRAVNIREKLLGDEDLDVAYALIKLADNYYWLENYTQAEPLYERALKIREKQLPAEHIDIAWSLVDLAGNCAKLGKYKQSLPLNIRAVNIREKLLGGEDLKVAYALNQLANNHYWLENYAQAEPLYERALKIREKKLPEEHLDVARSLLNLAENHAKLGKHKQSLPLSIRAVNIREKLLGSVNLDVAYALNELANNHNWLKDYAQAEPVYERALDIREKVLGPEHLHVAMSLSNLAYNHIWLGKFDDAERLYERALKIREKLLDPGHLDVAYTLDQLAYCFFRMEKYNQAEPLYERALAIREKALGPEHLNVALSLSNLADNRIWLKKFDEAERLHERALSIRESLLDSDHLDIAYTLERLAGCYRVLEKYSQAESFYMRALGIREKLQGPDHVDTAPILLGIATCYGMKGRHVETERLLQRALKIREGSFGRDHYLTAQVLAGLSNTYDWLGRYGEAIAQMERAFPIIEQNLGKEHIETLQTLRGLGALTRKLGRYSEAEVLFKRALRIHETLHQRVPATNADEYINTLNSLAMLYSHQDRNGDAEPLLKKALSISEKHLAPNHQLTCCILANLGDTYSFLARHAEAKSMLERAKVIRESTLGLDHPDTAHSYYLLGRLNRFLGNYAEAETHYNRSTVVCQKVYGANHPRTTQSLGSSAFLQVAFGKWAKAAKLTDDTHRGNRLHILRTLSSLSTDEQASFLATLSRDQFLAYTLGLTQKFNPEIASLSAGWLANGKAVAHEATAQQAILAKQTKDPKTAGIASDLTAVRARLALLCQLSPSVEELEDYQSNLKSLQSAERQLIHDIGGRLASLNPDETWVEIDDLRKSIQAGSVLIDIARFEVRDFAAENSSPNRWKPARYAAWITPPAGQGDIKIVDLGEAEVIDERVKQVRLSIEASQVIKERGEVLSEEATNQKLADLAALVLEPLLKEIAADTDRLLLSPDANLWLVPWAALPIDRDRYAVEKYELQFLTSARDLIPKSVHASINPRPVIIADPDFDLAPADALAATQQILQSKLSPVGPLAMRSTNSTSVLPKRVERLPFTYAEANAIKPFLERYTSKEPKVFSGRNALEGVFKALVRPRVLVLSTHGFFLEDQQAKPINDNLPGLEKRSIPLSTTGELIENPLLRCGLILAGYNQRDQAGEGDDGVLTGMEIVGTDLHGTELVVLSACQTGVGQINNGEGVAGLRQAFQIAGAKSVVASLWQIPDFETALLINDFFDNLAAGQSKSAALRNAQLSRIQARRDIHEAAHPFFWAAFSVTGQ